MKTKHLIIFCIVMMFSCSGGRYYSMSSLEISTINIAHYLYEDENIIIGAKIRSGGITGLFWYDLLIVNSGNMPIQLNWFTDILFLQLEGKKYQLSKISPITSYPNVINPNNLVNIGFSIDKSLNDKINNINELIIDINDRSYVLKKNENAKWE